MWNDNFWVWKEKNCQPIMFYVAKFFFNSEEVLLEKKTEGVAALAAAAPCCTCRGLLQLLARSQRRTARTD